MHYRTLGKTGRKVSILGFGAMRLPTIKLGEQAIKHDEAIKLIRKSIDAGVNYIDTAYNYHSDESELVVAKALKDGYREKVTLATKAPIWKKEYDKEESFDKYLTEQLKKLEVETIDVYLFHALNAKTWKKLNEIKAIESAKKAKEDGKINHLAFSFHDKPELLKEIIDSSAFEVMLVQYNILDTVNEEMIKYASDKGIGVVIMGPVGGGRLAGEPPESLKQYLLPEKKTFTDLALRYVWNNPYVDIALSGMGSDEMLDENLALASNEEHTLTDTQKKMADELGVKFKELTDNLCTNCKYCMPCEQEVNIAFIFQALINSQVYGQEDAAKRSYSIIGKEDWASGKNAEACMECGECLEKCPQKIPIIDQLKKAHKILT